MSGGGTSAGTGVTSTPTAIQGSDGVLKAYDPTSMAGTNAPPPDVAPGFNAGMKSTEVPEFVTNWLAQQGGNAGATWDSANLIQGTAGPARKAAAPPVVPKAGSIGTPASASGQTPPATPPAAGATGGITPWWTGVPTQFPTAMPIAPGAPGSPTQQPYPPWLFDSINNNQYGMPGMTR